tara:strand:+ start:275 stop:535 length:261 start_codon:yes stop_codon:yes gene_type:complete
VEEEDLVQLPLLKVEVQEEQVEEISPLEQQGHNLLNLETLELLVMVIQEDMIQDHMEEHLQEEVAQRRQVQQQFVVHLEMEEQVYL